MNAIVACDIWKHNGLYYHHKYGCDVQINETMPEFITTNQYNWLIHNGYKLHCDPGGIKFLCRNFCN